MAVYTFSRTLALQAGVNPVVAQSATGSLYDIADTTFTTPLNLTIVATNATQTTISSDPNGVFPDFTLNGRTTAVFKSGTFTCVLTTSDPIAGPQGAQGAQGVKGDKGDPGDVPTWKPNMNYSTVGQPMVNPDGDLVKLTTAHISGTTYDPTKFSVPYDTAVSARVNDGTSATRAALDGRYIPLTQKGSANGVAGLDASGNVAQPPKLHAASHATGGTDPITPANIGAVAKGDLIVNVMDYGAKGDGATDDTAAITSARNALQSGDVLFFPPHRTYLHTGLASGHINETWNVGVGSTLKLANGANTHCVTVTHSGFTIMGGGTIDGNRANQSASSWYGVFISAADDATVRDITIQNIVNRGIYSRNSNRTTVDRCKITLTGENAVLIESTASATPIYDPVVRNCKIDRTAEGSSLTEGGIKVHGNGYGAYRAKISGNTVLLPTMPNTAGTPQICIEVHSKSDRATVNGNTCVGGTMGVSIDSSTSAVVSDNNLYNFSYYGVEWANSPEGVCSANLLDGGGTGLNGIVQSAAGSHRTAITGNIIKNITQDGITLNGGNSCTVSANIISMPSGSRWGINVSGGPYYCTITGNGIDSQNANYSINVQPTAHITITGNTLNGNSVALKAIAVDRSTNVSIMGNVMRNYTQHGVLVYAQATGAFTLDEITIFGNTFNSVGTTVQLSISNGGALGSNILLGQSRYGVSLPQFATASRPSASTAGAGANVYDKTLSKPIWSDGTTWRDSTGTAV